MFASDSCWKTSCFLAVVMMRVDHAARNSNRFENKYALAGDLTTQVLEQARLFLSPDRGVDCPQYITTLYLETPDLTFYEWHHTRRIDRFKLRIRSYGQPPAGSAFVEIKGKSGKLGHKRRAKIELSKLNQVLAGIVPADSSALQDFLRVHNELNARPKVLMRFLRTAFRGYNTYGEVAITADREIVCQPAFCYDLVGNPQAWRPIALPEESSTLVELKYVDRPPGWMASLMWDLMKYRVRFSKYGTAMDQQLAQPELLLQRL
jgi:VTC domain-containing protein